MILLLILSTLSYYSHRSEILKMNDEIEIREAEIRRLNDVIYDWEKSVAEKDKEISLLNDEIEILKQSNVKYVGNFKITYYCACEKCCGKSNGITASGARAEEGVTVSADTSKLPFGTKIYIKGIGMRTVQDRGGAIKGNRIDVYVSSHDKIPSIGTYNTDVWMVME